MDSVTTCFGDECLRVLCSSVVRWGDISPGHGVPARSRGLAIDATPWEQHINWDSIDVCLSHVCINEFGGVLVALHDRPYHRRYPGLLPSPIPLRSFRNCQVQRRHRESRNGLGSFGDVLVHDRQATWQEQLGGWGLAREVIAYFSCVARLASPTHPTTEDFSIVTSTGPALPGPGVPVALTMYIMGYHASLVSAIPWLSSSTRPLCGNCYCGQASARVPVSQAQVGWVGIPQTCSKW
eukprot:6207640-Amphidinium_carterae.2